jgi:hypothetical protein
VNLPRTAQIPGKMGGMVLGSMNRRAQREREREREMDLERDSARTTTSDQDRTSESVDHYQRQLVTRLSRHFQLSLRVWWGNKWIQSGESRWNVINLCSSIIFLLHSLLHFDL